MEEFGGTWYADSLMECPDSLMECHEELERHLVRTLEEPGTTSGETCYAVPLTEFHEVRLEGVR